MKSLAAIAFAALIAAGLTVTSDAYARVKIPPGAHASVAATSEADIRQQCAQEAYGRWGRTNQDMQKNVDFALSTCLSAHGVKNP